MTLKPYYKHLNLLFCLLLFNSALLKAQSDSGITRLDLTAYIDAFYTYDFNEPVTEQRLPYIVNHNRHNEFNINLASIGLKIDNELYRANLTFQAGTYADDNYVNESALARSINEASAGLRLLKNNKLWLDVGILGSHIGFESPYQIDDLTLTRTIMAEAAPYFLTGAKLSYTFNEKWFLMVMITNGWQRIKRVEGNSLLSFGSQLQFKPGAKTTLNWGTFSGTDDPDATRRMRYFNELYALFEIGTRWDLQAGFDYGIQQRSKGSDEYDPWYLASILSRFSFHQKWSASARIEYIYDPQGIVINNPSPYDYIVYGFSANLDYKPFSQGFLRLEARYLQGENDNFVIDQASPTIIYSLPHHSPFVLGRDLFWIRR